MDDHNKLDVDTMTKEDLRNNIKNVIKKMGKDVSKEDKKANANLLVQIFEKGVPPRVAMRISDEDIAKMYLVAFHLFSTGKFLEAKELFKVLFFLEPTSPDFSTALGVCYQQLKEYKDALQYYMMAGTMDTKDPIPFFYAYGCFMSLDQKISAGMMLSQALKRAKEDPTKYSVIAEKAQTALDELTKEIVNK